MSVSQLCLKQNEFHVCWSTKSSGGWLRRAPQTPDVEYSLQGILTTFQVQLYHFADREVGVQGIKHLSQDRKQLQKWNWLMVPHIYFSVISTVSYNLFLYCVNSIYMQCPEKANYKEGKQISRCLELEVGMGINCKWSLEILLG